MVVAPNEMALTGAVNSAFPNKPKSPDLTAKAERVNPETRHTNNMAADIAADLAAKSKAS